MTNSQVSDHESKIAANLPRFIHHDRERIEACARISPWVAQLTVSFPLLFSALASSYGPLKPRSDAVAATVNGAPLHEISGIIGLPYCLRGLPPEACPNDLHHHHWSQDVSHRLGSRLPRRGDAAHYWLRILFNVAQRSDEEVAIWMAHEQRLVLLKRIHPDALQPLLLFAWYSLHHPDKVAYSEKWTPDINLRSAVSRCERWLRHLALFWQLNTEGVVDPWLPEVHTGELQIVPLTTPYAILDEAAAMQNCVADYGESVATGACRLFSVRTHGERVATLQLTLCQHGQSLILTAIRGPDNEDCPLHIAAKVRSIVSGYQPRRFSTALHRTFSERDALIDFLEPYLTAKPQTDQTWLATLTVDRLRAAHHQLQRLTRAFLPEDRR